MILASALYGGTAPFSSFPIFTGSKTVKFPDELEGTDALVVWGGEDIHPALYNDVNTHSSVYTDGPSTRDTYEWALMKEAIKRDIPIIGVCRGAQMLCAVAGGKLYQHVDNHGRSHNVHTDDEQLLRVSSLHHQMMNPAGTNHQVWMWSENKRSPQYFDARGTHEETSIGLEPEYVYFPDIKGHAIQWHPEFHDSQEACNIWLRDRICNVIG